MTAAEILSEQQAWRDYKACCLGYFSNYRRKKPQLVGDARSHDLWRAWKALRDPILARRPGKHQRRA